MAIDRYQLANELATLRDLAAERWSEDPLPVGRAALDRLKREIDEHDLHRNVAELETDGYTVLPPGKAGPLSLIEEIKAAMRRLQETRPSDALGASSGLGATLFHMLPEDPAFEQALMAPAPLVLVTYLLGYRAKLSQCTGLIKDTGAPALPIHADHSGKFPAPWGKLSNYTVVTWVLTDYTRENGALCVWPGSHRWGRPVPAEMRMAHDHEEMRVVEVPAGSVIAWHGSLWHGAVPRAGPDSGAGTFLGFDDSGDDRAQSAALCNVDGADERVWLDAGWSRSPAACDGADRRLAVRIGLACSASIKTGELELEQPAVPRNSGDDQEFADGVEQQRDALVLFE